MKTDILIIGGGPAGIVAGITARKNNPEKKIILVRDKEKTIVPCGIPYIFNRLKAVEKNLMSDEPLKKNKIDLLINQAICIRPDSKKVILENNKKISYEKLILATGSRSVQIPIKGITKKGCFQIRKDANYLKELFRAVEKAKNIVIVGGGFIGVELAEELSGVRGVKISIIEKLAHCLITTFDKEFALAAEKKLKEKGVKIYAGLSIEEIGGKGRVEYVKLTNNQKISSDLVIVSIGARPNVSLAKETGIRLGDYGGIWVDEYMKTNISDIFAVGDCAETRDFLTGRHIPVMLASTASAEARIAADNLYQIKNLRKNKGTLGAFSTYVNGLILSVVSLTETGAQLENFEIVIGESECLNHHPGTLPDTRKITVKLVFSQASGRLLGGQVMGPESISEMINLLALSIQKETTAYELNNLQISTHPLLTASPIVYPLITAAQQAIGKMEK